MARKKRDFDEFDFDENQMNEAEQSLNVKAFYGVRCPGSGCAVCRDVSQLWDKHRDSGYGQQDESKYSKRARKFGKKRLIYMNVVFPDKPDEVRIMECGIKMQRAIMDGIRRQGWGNIVHPKEGMTLKVIRSEEGGFPSYIPSPDIAKGKRALEDMSVLDNLYNLDRIDELREGGVDIFKINTIKDSVTFDILPGWNPDKRHIFYLLSFYHFNVTPGAIETGISGNIESTADKIVDEDRDESATKSSFDNNDGKVDSTPPDWDKGGDWGDEQQKPEPEEQKNSEPEATPKHTIETAPKCFGLFYEEEDEGCQETSCDDIREECMKRTYKSQK